MPKIPNEMLWVAAGLGLMFSMSSNSENTIKKLLAGFGKSRVQNAFGRGQKPAAAVEETPFGKGFLSASGFEIM